MIDIRSDTVTLPTQKMREVMYTAIVGDDVYDDDPTVKELESYAADLLGKESSLFVPTGTFGNQLALFTHCKHGDEVILGDDSHIVQHEVGAASIIAGVQFRTLSSDNGILDTNEIKAKIREQDLHYPKTGLICLENAHSNGRVVPYNKMKEIYELAKKNNLPVHTDGARFFNAAEFLGIQAHELARLSDSIMFCLSKGLCAPVGSILAGNKAFIDKAKKNRKLMGGGMRQVGFLAAAGLVALKEMRSRLKVDHNNAKKIADALDKIACINVLKDNLDINMVFFTVNKKIKASEFVKFMLKKGIKINNPENSIWRFVTNNDLQEKDINLVINAIQLFFT